MASAGSPKTHIIPLSQFKSATQAEDDAREGWSRCAELSSDAGSSPTLV
jgi:hypothetical protein